MRGGAAGGVFVSRLAHGLVCWCVVCLVAASVALPVVAMVVVVVGVVLVCGWLLLVGRCGLVVVVAVLRCFWPLHTRAAAAAVYPPMCFSGKPSC